MKLETSVELAEVFFLRSRPPGPNAASDAIYPKSLRLEMCVLLNEAVDVAHGENGVVG